MINKMSEYAADKSRNYEANLEPLGKGKKQYATLLKGVNMKDKKLLKAINDISRLLIELNDRIGRNPETGFKEYKACEWLTNILSEHDFKIKKGIGDLETAFRAEIEFSSSGPSIAFLCEYDALPEIGHGCGHNMIGVMSCGAAIGLSKLKGLDGRIVVVGCPGEEVGGGKVTLVEKGIFTDIDAAMMVHPSDVTRVYSTSLAIEALKFTYYGKSAHAASSPEKGINALDGVIQLFNGINAMRQHLKDDVRIHGIISKGGESPNVVPALAEARFYFRARDKNYLQEVIKRGKKIAHGAAEMTGCKVEYESFENANDNLKPNKRLANLYKEKLVELGVNNIAPPRDSSGSTDMGNVSQVVPSIHPYISIGKGLTGHTREFAEATMSDKGHRALLTGVRALSLTGLELLSNDKIMEEIKKEFCQNT